MKYLLAFLGGAAVGAAGMAYLKKKQMKVEELKPIATDIIQKGMEFRDKIVGQLDALRKDLEFVIKTPAETEQSTEKK